MNEIDEYDYDLPRELIAQDPCSTRSDSRLMLVDRNSGQIEHLHVRDLPDVVTPQDAVIFNNSRVVPARLVGYRKDTGGRWQGLFLRADPETGVWEVLTKTRGKLKAGERLTVQDRNARDGMELEVVARTEGGNLLVKPHLPDGFVALGTTDGGWTNQQTGLSTGRILLPPYIRDGQMVDADIEHYQTVFAKHRGSVAARSPACISQMYCRIDANDGVFSVRISRRSARFVQFIAAFDHQTHSEWGSLMATCASSRKDVTQVVGVLPSGPQQCGYWNQLQDKVRNSNPGRVKPISSFARPLNSGPSMG